MAKNIHKGGESLPLARTSLLATPSSGGHPRNAPVDTPIEAPYELVVKMTSCHFYFSSFHFALQNKNSRIYC